MKGVQLVDHVSIVSGNRKPTFGGEEGQLRQSAHRVSKEEVCEQGLLPMRLVFSGHH